LVVFHSRKLHQEKKHGHYFLIYGKNQQSVLCFKYFNLSFAVYKNMNTAFLLYLHYNQPKYQSKWLARWLFVVKTKFWTV